MKFHKLAVYITILLSCLLLAGCRELALPLATPTPAYSEIPLPDTSLQPSIAVSLTVTDIITVGTTQDQIAIVWAGSLEEAWRYTKRFHVGLLDLANRQAMQIIPEVSMVSEYPPEILWSPDGTRLMLHGPTSLSGYDILVFPLVSGAVPYLLADRVYGGFWCKWFPPSDGRYIICGYASHGEPTTYWVHDGYSWEFICEVDWVISRRPCPLLPLAKGQWLYFASQFGVPGKYPKIINSAEKPAPDATPDPKPSPRAQPSVIQEICQTRFTGCDRWTYSPMGRFITLWERSQLYLVDTQERQFWKFADTGGLTLSWSPDEQYLTWVEDGQILVFDTTRHAIATHTLPNSWVMSAAWSPAH